MTIAEALKKYKDVEADLLLGHVLKQSKEFLYLHPAQKLTAPQKANFERITKKRQAGMPAAYLLGYKYFYGLKFKVNRNVLIPRPETEWLVDETLGMIKRRLRTNPTKALRILDVGTGSGCIAISIAKNVDPRKVKIYATDISLGALTVAKENARENKVKVKFSEHNLLSDVKGKFDVIIANLPYVPISDYQHLNTNLKYEPKNALTDDSENFILIQRLLSQASKKLSTKGKLMLEIDPKAAVLFTNYSQVIITKDMHGLNRFISMPLTALK